MRLLQASFLDWTTSKMDRVSPLRSRCSQLRTPRPAPPGAQGAQGARVPWQTWPLAAKLHHRLLDTASTLTPLRDLAPVLLDRSPQLSFRTERLCLDYCASLPADRALDEIDVALRLRRAFSVRPNDEGSFAWARDIELCPRSDTVNLGPEGLAQA